MKTAAPPPQDASTGAAPDAAAIEGAVLQALEEAKVLNAQYEEAYQRLSRALVAAVSRLVPPGTVLENFHYGLGRARVASGNARGATSFEVVGKLWALAVDVRYLSLTRFCVEAYPLNDKGKRLSGRAGNSSKGQGDTVTLHLDLAADRGPDDERSSEEMALDVIRTAARHALPQASAAQ